VARFPETRRDDIVEVLHGTTIADPYRWLEDPDSAETADWVKRQNEFTTAYLESLPDRPWFVQTMQQVMRQPRAGVPFKRAGHYFVSRNDGRQNQDVIFVALSLKELLAGGRVLVDPNIFSADGTISLTTLNVSGDGQLVAYGVSEAGSDWTIFRLLSLPSGDRVDDAPVQTKFSEAEWLPDHRSYVYTHFDHGGNADGTETGALSGPKLRVHSIGEPQDHDELILEFPENDQLMFWAEVTDDDRYLVVSIVEGTENKNRLWVYPIISGEATKLGAPSRSRSSMKRWRNSSLPVRTAPRSIFERIWKPKPGGWSLSILIHSWTVNRFAGERWSQSPNTHFWMRGQPATGSSSSTLPTRSLASSASAWMVRRLSSWM
jgi:prolyl oligopeptidase